MLTSASWGGGRRFRALRILLFTCSKQGRCGSMKRTYACRPYGTRGRRSSCVSNGYAGKCPVVPPEEDGHRRGGRAGRPWSNGAAIEEASCYD